MPRYVSVHSQKGGVGKSLLCLQMATALNEAGYKTAILDFDVQGTLIVLSTDRKIKSDAGKMEPLPFPVYYKDDISKVLKQLDDDTIILLDFLPSSKASEVAKAGEVFVVPFKAARPDESSAVPGIMMLRELGIPTIPVINFYNDKSQSAYREQIENKVGPCLTVDDRQIYVNCMNNAVGVWESSITNTLLKTKGDTRRMAQDEIYNVTHAVLNALNKIKPLQKVSA